MIAIEGNWEAEARQNLVERLAREKVRIAGTGEYADQALCRVTGPQDAQTRVRAWLEGGGPLPLVLDAGERLPEIMGVRWEQTGDSFWKQFWRPVVVPWVPPPDPDDTLGMATMPYTGAWTVWMKLGDVYDYDHRQWKVLAKYAHSIVKWDSAREYVHYGWERSPFGPGLVIYNTDSITWRTYGGVTTFSKKKRWKISQPANEQPQVPLGLVVERGQPWESIQVSAKGWELRHMPRKTLLWLVTDGVMEGVGIMKTAVEPAPGQDRNELRDNILAYLEATASMKTVRRLRYTSDVRVLRPGRGFRTRKKMPPQDSPHLPEWMARRTQEWLTRPAREWGRWQKDGREKYRELCGPADGEVSGSLPSTNALPATARINSDFFEEHLDWNRRELSSSHDEPTSPWDSQGIPNWLDVGWGGGPFRRVARAVSSREQDDDPSMSGLGLQTAGRFAGKLYDQGWSLLPDEGWTDDFDPYPPQFHSLEKALLRAEHIWHRLENIRQRAVKLWGTGLMTPEDREELEQEVEVLDHELAWRVAFWTGVRLRGRKETADELLGYTEKAQKVKKVVEEGPPEEETWPNMPAEESNSWWSIWGWRWGEGRPPSEKEIRHALRAQEYRELEAKKDIFAEALRNWTKQR